MLFPCHCSTCWTLLSLLILVSITVTTAQQNEGIAIWANAGHAPPGYALWDGTSFSESKRMQSTGKRWRIIEGAVCPTRDEVIVVGVTEDERVTAQMYNGRTWSDLPFSPTLTDKASNSYLRGFDVQYESKSGNALLVWHRGVGDKVLYRTWDGSSWSAQLQVRSPVIGGEHNYLHLAANPNSDEMVLVVRVRDGSDYGSVWNGESWDNGIKLENSVNTGLRSVNVVYEQKRGRAMVVYADNSPFLRYRVWDGFKWSKERSVTPPPGNSNNIRRIAIGEDPSSNRIVVGVTVYNSNAFWLGIWNGKDRWESVMEASPGSTAEIFHGIAVAFEGGSGKALACYTKENHKVLYRIWSEKWSGENDGPNLAERPNSMRLSTSPKSNDVILSVQDNGQDANFCAWDGLSWGTVHTMTNNTGEVLNKNHPFLFLWKPTPPPTNSPTPEPTIEPTHSPTLDPTPLSKLHTMKPTQEVIPLQKKQISTEIPMYRAPTPTFPPRTSRPTLAPTRFVGLRPSPKPTKSHTNAPTTRPPPLRPTPTKPQRTANGTGQICLNNTDCKSNTCRSGVCMASAECYPVKHKYGTPFDKHKINLVFVASDFDRMPRDAWHAQVRKTYTSFNSFNMFSKEIEQLNVFLVDSPELQSSFCTQGCKGIDRLLCCDITRAHQLSTKCFPVGETLQTIVIHNSPEYGGAGYGVSNMATASVHPGSPRVAVHELGHSLFQLADEYAYGKGTGSRPNCEYSRSCDKWSDLVGRKNTPSRYETVQCIQGCSDGNYYVGAKSFMEDIDFPVGAVNERYTCCTYLALTKSMPSYCDVFDVLPNYLYNFCKHNDYQNYGPSNYDPEPVLAIPGAALDNSKAKYIYVSDPALVTIAPRKNGDAELTMEPTPLQSGIFAKSQVRGDYPDGITAANMGEDSVLRVVVVYRTGKEVLLFSQTTTIEVPLPLPGDSIHQGDPGVVSAQLDSIEIVLDTKGREVERIHSKVVELDEIFSKSHPRNTDEVDDANAKYIQISEPVLVTITARNDNTELKVKRTPLQPGLFPRSKVEGDFVDGIEAAKSGADSLLRVVVIYQTGKKEVLLCSQTTTIDVPLPLPGDSSPQKEPGIVTRKSDITEVVLETKGRAIESIRAKEVELKNISTALPPNHGNE